MKPMSEAPKDGTPITVFYEDGSSSGVFWSERPVCMGGPTVYQPPGWASDGSECDYNLPMDADGMIGWKEQ